ncbi:MAG: GIY-YIG nuclease family protein [Polaribacter sp.]|nr:GIY-YIG nuclease family protein [Polaribacter sp.]
MFYVYVLKSIVDGRLYKGFTQDIGKRLKEHNFGKTKSTKGYKPWVLIYSEEVETRKDARESEKYLKSGIGREFLKNVLKEKLK